MASLTATTVSGARNPSSGAANDVGPPAIAVHEPPSLGGEMFDSGASQMFAGRDDDAPPVVLRVPDLDSEPIAAKVDEAPKSPALDLRMIQEWLTSEVGYWVLLGCGALLAAYLIAGGASATSRSPSSIPAQTTSDQDGNGSREPVASTAALRAGSKADKDAGRPTEPNNAASSDSEPPPRDQPKASLTGRILKSPTR